MQAGISWPACAGQYTHPYSRKRTSLISATADVTDTQPLSVWRFRDGLAGHERQTDGLLQGVRHWTTIDVREVDETAARRLLGEPRRLHQPDLLIGAGHTVHLSLLRMRLRFGGKSVVLMKPSLPTVLFDLVLVPEHDELWFTANVERTRGALCPFVDSESERGRGTVLLGGTNRYFHWDNVAVAEQVRGLVTTLPDVQWTLSDSRRTPDGLLNVLPDSPNLTAMSWHDTPQGWVIDQLAKSSYAWVSADSASMLYEALSAGCAVGVIDLPQSELNNKLERGIAALAEDGLVARSSDGFDLSGQLGQLPLRENLRAGRLILERFFPALLDSA